MDTKKETKYFGGNDGDAHTNRGKPWETASKENKKACKFTHKFNKKCKRVGLS